MAVHRPVIDRPTGKKVAVCVPKRVCEHTCVCMHMQCTRACACVEGHKKYKIYIDIDIFYSLLGIRELIWDHYLVLHYSIFHYNLTDGKKTDYRLGSNPASKMSDKSFVPKKNTSGHVQHVDLNRLSHNDGYNEP